MTQSIEARIGRLERDAPSEWDKWAVINLYTALVMPEVQKEGQQVDPGDFPNLPQAADDPFWGGLDNPLGQLYRELCLAILRGQGGAQEASE